MHRITLPWKRGAGSRSQWRDPPEAPRRWARRAGSSQVATEDGIDAHGGHRTVGAPACTEQVEPSRFLRSDNLVDHLLIICFGTGRASRNLIRPFDLPIIGAKTLIMASWRAELLKR